MVAGAPKAPTQQTIDAFSLSLSCALFKTPTLHSRLYGLTSIRDAIQRVSSSSSSSLLPSSSSSSSSSLLLLLQRGQVLEELLGANMHTELLTRADTLLHFFAQHNVCKPPTHPPTHAFARHTELLTRADTLLHFFAHHNVRLTHP